MSNIKNYINGYKKHLKTDFKHVLLELRNASDCKEELVFFCMYKHENIGKNNCF